MLYEFEHYICDVKQPELVSVTADNRAEAVEKAYLQVGLHPQHYNRPDTLFILANTEAK